MTASAVTSSVQASKNSATTSSNSSNNFHESFIKPTNDTYNRTSNNTNTNGSWSHPFLPDLTPSIPLTSSYGGYPSLENPQLPVQTSTSSSRLSNLPLFQSYHSSMYFLRANNLAQLSPIAGAGSAIGGSHASRISSASKTNSSLLGTAQTTSRSAPVSSSSSVAASVSSSSVQQGAPLTVAATVELSSASSSTSTTTISMHSASKTPPTTAPTILSTSKRPVIIIYPTVSPESIVVPIVSCIFGFPLFALLVICCLRRRAKLARERDRRRNYDMQDHAVSLVRFSPIHRLNNRSSRAISLRPERSLSRGFPSLELDTVIEERSDPEQTQTDLLSPESPLDPQKFREFNSS